jgi:hypothetical protein
MAENVVVSLPLLIITAVLSGECVKKLKILRKQFQKYQNKVVLF